MANKLKAGAKAKIRYSKDGEITERVIVPTQIPTNIKALDLSDLEEATQDVAAKLYAEYQSYLKQHMKTAYSFEEWAEQSEGFEITPKWRTFKPAQTEVL